MLIFSGGSAVSSFVPMLQKITDNVCYVMPVSDDGGSTFEIVKVMGGPGIGDIRSRILGLADTSTVEGLAVYKLLTYRLPMPTSAPSLYAACPAKSEWMNILEGNHVLWEQIPLPHQRTIRSFLFQFHDHLLKGTAGSHIISNGEQKQTFDFRGGCIGNFFITGCRLFFHSLEAAIFQFSKLVGCPNKTLVLPIVATSHLAVSIGVSLRNGTHIHGQCEISHPGVTAAPLPRRNGSSLSCNPPPVTQRRAVFEIESPSPSNVVTPGTSLSNPNLLSSTTPAVPITANPSAISSRLKRSSMSSFKKFNLSNSLDFAPLNWNRSSGSLMSASSSNMSNNLFFSKSHTEVTSLVSPIRRVFYINKDGAEVVPHINDLLPKQLKVQQTIIYGMGSLYTSLLPCLVVPGVGGLVAQDAGTPACRNKILLLNGTHDRESEGYTALDFVLAVTDALNASVISERGGPGMVNKVMQKRDASTDMEGADQVWRWRGALVGTGGGVGGKGVSSVGTGMSDAETLMEELFVGGESSVGSDFDEEEEEDDEQDVSEMQSPGGRGYLVTPYPPSAYITHLLYTEDSQVAVEVEEIELLGIKCVRVDKIGGPASPTRVERGSVVNVSTLSSRTPGHFGVEELRRVLEPILAGVTTVE
ncbi:hypothetical protein HDU98_004581 [Podochytrium sp. JEL0797]|nr:hypothetical protein HDU98_004581 [Podochytrium sp. JEL0797]